MSSMTSTFQHEYQSLREGAALQLRPDAGVLALTDADRVDFLQRMTTNNIQALAGGQSCVTVLTSPTAKIVQVFTVLAREDDLLLLPARGATQALAKHLRSQIFFMDKVKVGDLTPGHMRLRLMGPHALTVVAATGLDMNDAREGEWRSRNGFIAVLQRQFDVPGYELVVEQEKQDELLSRLAAVQTAVLDSDDAYHALRVELGRPLPGAELMGEYNPLEAGLAWACAENKGCYTGQEIIARQVTYDKVTRSLAGVVGATPMTAGAALSSGGREVGTITSVAYSPLLNAPVALAIVKRPHEAAGTELLSADQAVQVVALPFAGR
jgi:folate-binding protein YgfZ